MHKQPSRNFNDYSESYTMAVQLFNSGKYEEALQIFVDLNQKEGQKGSLWNPIIQSYRNLHFNSFQILEKLQLLFQSNYSFQIAFNISENYLSLGLIEQAKTWFQRSIDIDPTFKQCYFRLSDILQKENKIEEEIALLQRCRTNNPFDEEVLLRLCKCYNEVQDFEEANDCYQELTKVNPHKSQYYLSFVQMNAQSQNFSSAKCRQYLQLGLSYSKKKDHYFYFLQGLVLYKQNRFEAAIEAFKKSMKLDQKYFGCYVWLSFALKKSGLMCKAIQLLQYFVKMNPTHLSVWDYLAMNYWEQYGFVKFTQAVQQIEKIQGKYFVHTIGSFYLHAGLIQNSIDYFQAWTIINKRVMIVSQIPRKCYSVIGNWEKVVNILLYKKSLNKISIEQKVQLGEAYLKLNKVEEYNTVIEELEIDLFNHQFRRSEKVLFMGLLLKANKLDRCMQVYDSHLIVSQEKLQAKSRMELQMTLIQCHFRLNEVPSAFRIYGELHKTMKSKQSLSSESLIKFIEIQRELLRDEDIGPFCQMLRNNIEKKSAEGDFLQEIVFGERMRTIEKQAKEEAGFTDPGNK